MLKEKIKTGSLSGVLIKISRNPAILHLLKESGHDFVFYDCEHGDFGYETLHDLLVMGNVLDLPGWVRVPELAKEHVSRCLDCGAKGVMVPMIESKEQAEKLVYWSKYAPLGGRGYAGGANTGYAPGGNHKYNMAQANREIMTIAQIETEAGIENLEAIAAVDGIDAVIIGPADLSISMGVPDDIFHERELAAISRAARICRQQAVGFGIIGSMKLLKHFSTDLDIFISGTDVSVMRAGFAKLYEEYREISEEAG